MLEKLADKTWQKYEPVSSSDRGGWNVLYPGRFNSGLVEVSAKQEYTYNLKQYVCKQDRYVEDLRPLAVQDEPKKCIDADGVYIAAVRKRFVLSNTEILDEWLDEDVWEFTGETRLDL